MLTPAVAGRSQHKAMKTLLPFLMLAAPLFASEQQDVDKVLRKYQTFFGMGDWTLTVHLDTIEAIRKRIGCSTCVAVSEWSTDGPPYTGEIWVARRSEYTPEFWRSFGMKPHNRKFAAKDQRNSVVHELVHALWRYGSEEAAVSMLAGAINP